MHNNGSITRRDFLGKAIGGLAAAVALPNIITSAALGSGGRLPASERITMGFVGLGGQGTGHLLGGAWTYVPGGYIAREDVQILAVCDVRRERRDEVQKRCNKVYADKTGQAGYSSVQAYNDFRELLARPDIDAVLLALPYHWAAPMSMMAARAGKDVYCEKPIAVTVQEGRDLVETCKRYGRIYQAGTQQRSEYGGKFRLACELVRNGRIGQLKEVYAYRQPGVYFPSEWTSDQSKPVPEGLDWDLWLGPLPWRPYNGSLGHALPGCYVGDINWGPHHYDIIQWTINPDATAPVEIQYDGNVHYHYSNGVILHSTPYPGEPVGGEGGACFVGTEGRIAVDRHSIVSYPGEILNTPQRPDDKRVYRATSHSGNFLECVRSRRQPICDPETAVRTINSLISGGMALAFKRSLKWDPVKSEFIGDEQANRFLSYTPRAPWRT